MDKELDLNELTKLRDELLSIKQDSTAIFDKNISLLKYGGELTNQLLKAEADYNIAVLTFEAEHYLKMIDVWLDMLKVLIPILFSIWTATRIIPQLSGTSTLVTITLILCVISLGLVISIRMVKVDSYVAKFRAVHQKIASDHLDWQEQRRSIETLARDDIKRQNELFRMQYDSIIASHP